MQCEGVRIRELRKERKDKEERRLAMFEVKGI